MSAHAVVPRFIVTMFAWIKGRSSNAPILPSVQKHAAPEPEPSSPTVQVAHTPLSPAPADPYPSLSTPHDAALAELNAKLEQLDEIVIPQRQSTMDTVVTASDSTSHILLPEAHSHRPLPSTECAYDPFTGMPVGFMIAEPEKDSSVQDDAMWAHLSSIRELQSEIAKMHIKMETVADLDEDGLLLDESGDFLGEEREGNDAGAQSKKEAKLREAEFRKLANRFKGRKDAIDGIMEKMHKLSQSVTVFHSLPSPTVRVGNTRPSAPGSPELLPPAPYAVATGPSVPLHAVTADLYGGKTTDSPTST